MKKVGILTFHYADNYGAVIQSFALKKVISQITNYNVCLINYVPRGYSYVAYEEGKYGLQSYKEKRKKFNEFLIEECGLNKEIVDDINENDYDYICVGSDQVWNIEQSEIFGTENSEMMYFLPNVEDGSKCFSYAASIGTDINKLSPTPFIKYIKKFAQISIRETTGYKEFLKDTCGIDSVGVLDPTLILKNSEYNKLMDKCSKKEKNFIFFFRYQTDDKLLEQAEFANILSRKYKMPVVHNVIDCPEYLFKYNGGCMYYSGIEDFLWYIKNAKCVVTNSFHVCALSIKFEKNFYCIAEYRSGRIKNLLSLLGLENRMLKGKMQINDVISDIDYVKVNSILQKEIDRSIKFLEGVLL